MAKRRSKPLLITANELAERLATTRRSVTTYIRQGMPVAKEGTSQQPHLFDLDACVAWLNAHNIIPGKMGRPSLEQEAGELTPAYVRGAGGGSVLPTGLPPINAPVIQAKLRKEMATAEGHEIKNAILKRQLVDRREVIATHVGKVVVVKKRLLRLVETAAARFGSDVRGFLESHVQSICSEFSKGIDAVGVTQDDVRAVFDIIGLGVVAGRTAGLGVAGAIDPEPVGGAAPNAQRNRKPRRARTVRSKSRAVPKSDRRPGAGAGGDVDHLDRQPPDRKKPRAAKRDGLDHV